MKSEELVVRVFFKEESFHVVAEKKLFSKLLKTVEGRKSLYGLGKVFWVRALEGREVAVDLVAMKIGKTGEV